MKLKKEKLIRLSGRSAFTGSRYVQGLYLGSDYLLGVINTGYAEKYRRFYFTEIQSITIRKMDDRLLNTVSMIPLAFLLSLIVVGMPNVGFPWLVISGFISAFGGFNILLGTRCVVRIQTDVLNERIAGLGRIRRARTVINRLTRRIAEAQADMAIPTSEPVEEAKPEPSTTEPATGNEY